MQEQCINLTYKLNWPIQYFKAPTNFSKINHLSIPRRLNLRQGTYEQTVKISFLGDLMGLGAKKLIIDDCVMSCLDQSDYFMFNLESVLIDQKSMILEKQYTHQSVFEHLMGQLNSSRVLVGIANNHIFDYGALGVNSTIDIIESTKAKYLGLKSKPTVIIKDGLEVCASTLWYRKEDTLVNRFSDVRSSKNDVIHFMHWGKEFQLLPTVGQKKLVSDLENDSICIVGHHSHSPQPINLHKGNVVAYSLGNMATGYCSNKINTGIIMTVTFGRNKVWKPIEVNWDFVTLKINSNQCLLQMS